MFKQPAGRLVVYWFFPGPGGKQLPPTPFFWGGGGSAQAQK